MPQPDGSQGVRRFLGMANFVSRFVPNISKLSAPLRSLTEQDNEWVWDPVHEKSFQDVKEAIARSSTLKFFNPSDHTTVQCDASSQGLGAIFMRNGHPMAFASRSLSSAEINYCQIEKELLAVVFAMHRFDQYVYGRHVWIESDHQPLQILTKKQLKDVPQRMQRMLLELQRYDFTVTYKKESFFSLQTPSQEHIFLNIGPSTMQMNECASFRQKRMGENLFDERNNRIVRRTHRPNTRADPWGPNLKGAANHDKNGLAFWHFNSKARVKTLFPHSRRISNWGRHHLQRQSMPYSSCHEKGRSDQASFGAYGYHRNIASSQGVSLSTGHACMRISRTTSNGATFATRTGRPLSTKERCSLIQGQRVLGQKLALTCFHWTRGAFW